MGNPLGLWLIRIVYVVGQRDPTPLIDADHPDREGGRCATISLAS